MAPKYTEIELAGLIVHSLLLSNATPDQLAQYCEEADRFKFAAVCVFPTYVRQATELLRGKRPKVCAVIGFPTGAHTSAVKLYEAQEAAENGATELDVVINQGKLKSGDTDGVHHELAEIVEATGLTVKAILEMNLLTPAEKRLAADLCMDAGVEYLKTGTGWHGAVTVADVQLLKEITKNRIGIKAAGGIRTAEQAFELILAGATRLGTSRGPDLIRQLEHLGDSLEEGLTQP